MRTFRARARKAGSDRGFGLRFFAGFFALVECAFLVARPYRLGTGSCARGRPFLAVALVYPAPACPLNSLWLKFGLPALQGP